YFGLDFKLSGQIIDSNFHPLSISSKYLLRDHNDLTVFALNLTTKVLLPISLPALPVPRMLHLRTNLRHAHVFPLLLPQAHSPRPRPLHWLALSLPARLLLLQWVQFRPLARQPRRLPQRLLS